MTTKTKPANALSQLEALEREVEKARADRSAKGVATKQASDQYRSLAGERERLIKRDPSLVDHNGGPISANAVTKVDKAILSLGDLNDLAAQYEHAKKHEAAARSNIDEHIRANYAELAEDVRPGGEQVVAEVAETVAAAREALDHYIAYYQRSAGLTAPIQGITTHVVPGIDSASHLRRVLADLENLPVPAPVLS